MEQKKLEKDNDKVEDILESSHLRTEKLIKVFSPTVRSGWFLFLGLVFGPLVIFFERDPDGHPAKWAIMFIVFLGLIIHRLSLKYILTNKSLTVESWWGLGREQKIDLADISAVSYLQGFTGRLVGCGHLSLASFAATGHGVMILGQPNPQLLVTEIEDLAKEARVEKVDGSA